MDASSEIAKWRLCLEGDRSTCQICASSQLEILELDPEPIIGVLHKWRVEYVVIGGIAATFHGSTTVTRDFDICYSRERANLERLASALRELDARLRDVDVEVPFQLDAASLRNGLNFTFKTKHGDFDCFGDPGGGFDYELLKRNADRMDVAGRKVMVASLDDIIAMKRAAGRNKDRIEVENLSALREVRDKGRR